MTINRKATGTASTVPTGLTYGSLVFAAMVLSGCVLATKLIEKEILDWNQSGYVVLVILLLSSWMGAMVSAAKIKRRRMAVCIGSGVVHLLLLLCATALFFGGKYSGVGETALLIFCGSMVAVFTGAQGKNRRKSIKTKASYR